LKARIKYILQRFLGIERYLFWFARFKIKTLKKDRKESAFFQFLDAIKTEQGVILDIGANIGVMSYHATKYFPKKDVHAFEPIPLNLKTIRKVKKHFQLDKVFIHDLALSNESSVLEMVLPEEENVTLHGLAHVIHPDIKTFNSGKTFEVQASSLDQWMSDNMITQLAGIKLDVENFELFVLEGGQKTLKQFKPIILTELWDNENRINCFQFMKAHNYVCFVIESGCYIKFENTDKAHQNFLFVPSSKIALLD